MLVGLIAFGILQMFVEIPNGALICLDILNVSPFFLSIFSGGTIEDHGSPAGGRRRRDLERGGGG